jgi:hypothetical protein
MDKRCSRPNFFFRTQRHIAITIISLIGHVSFLVQRPIQGAGRPGGGDTREQTAVTSSVDHRRKKGREFECYLRCGTNWSYRTVFPNLPQVRLEGSSSWCRSCNYDLAATCTIISLLTMCIPHYDEIPSKVYRMRVKHMLYLPLSLLKPVTDVTSITFWSGT